MPLPSSVQRSKPAEHAQGESNIASRRAKAEARKYPERPEVPAADVLHKDVYLDGKIPCKPIDIPPCTSEEDEHALCNAPEQPPVTKASLRELDLMLIQSNINLRVDINYDHDLHFTPVSGQKGEKKKLEALLYWQSLVAEFRITYHNNFVTSCIECKRRFVRGRGAQSNFHPRLPGLFFNLKELLTILVPDRDADQIAQFLDIPLLVQEASHSMLDVVRLGRWLCELLTTHCAPMRDGSALEMAEKIREGAETGDMTALVDGIKKLFDFLEAMKLDVANHQIRSFRFHLIEDTVPFQKDHFRIRIQNNKFNVDAPREWFLQNVKGHEECQGGGKLPTKSPLAALLHGLVQICVSNGPNFPETLKHDVCRLQNKRDQIQDIIHIDICLSVFDHQILRLVGHRFDPASLHPLLETRIKELQTRILDLTDGHMRPNQTMAEMWSQHDGEIALELTNAAFSVCKRVGCVLPASEVETTRKQLAFEFAEERQHARRAQLLAQALERGAQTYAHAFQSMTTLAISEAQKRDHHARHQPQHENQQWRQMPSLEDMARKLAHVAVIHMRVWWDLVYLPDEAEPGIGVEVKEEDMHDEDFV
ncbi:uncharacterized protein A1O9_03353 [Exophiala aquamarina CBS 119918]|uniref:Uncharacterized protein n=1 Tax=Exophiala aquamarina CBS 119918 TaxID=1182545 RepID=A0A072PR57_9EURO|nr:uncharacterized protein A1O9_03353 [Exophiala aquamarina CBS 119918]KEF61783.1 hypothetical protein A1O9_03353 [Exophiala aquamarina CBS 119918]